MPLLLIAIHLATALVIKGGFGQRVRLGHRACSPGSSDTSSAFGTRIHRGSRASVRTRTGDVVRTSHSQKTEESLVRVRPCGLNDDSMCHSSLPLYPEGPEASMTVSRNQPCPTGPTAIIWSTGPLVHVTNSLHVLIQPTPSQPTTGEVHMGQNLVR